MIQVVETTPIGDSISHKVVEYSRATTFKVDDFGGVYLYDKEDISFAYYSRGSFSSVVIYKR
jgi:hypothetical protein